MDQTQPTPDVDISKQTLVVLVALSCIISIIGVIAMVYEISSARPAPLIVENSGEASAQASLTINGVVPRPGAQGTGFATFSIGG
jgi:hypothetical protein